MKNKYYFISDAHFASGSDNEELKIQALEKFAEIHTESMKELFLVGDIFDFWFEYKEAIPRHYFRVLKTLSNIASSGTKITYVAGNHDFWVGDFLEKEVGIKTCFDQNIFMLENKKFFIHHGDGLSGNDWKYLLLKVILRNKLNIFLYQILHPDLGIRFARFLSSKSRKSGRTKADMGEGIKEFKRIALEKLKEDKDLFAVILGHLHFGTLEKTEHGTYANCGNWIKDFNYTVFDGKDLELFRFEG